MEETWGERPLPEKQSSDDLEFVFYQPNRPGRSFRRLSRPTKAKWERLTERIGHAAGQSERLEVHSLLMAFQPCSTDTILQAASRLASSASTEKRTVREFILISLCTVLYNSGRAAPEELDEFIKTVVQSSVPKYLDKVKRGARVANEIIAKWAERYTRGGDLLYRLDQTTQAVLQARLSMSQWGVLSENRNQVTERVLSYPLPQVQAATQPLLVPRLIDCIVNKLIKLPDICYHLGYSTELASCIATVPYYDFREIAALENEEDSTHQIS